MTKKGPIRMGRPHRMSWLMQAAVRHGRLDILNKDLVVEFVEATGAATQPKNFGADGCRTMAQDLKALHDGSRLIRSRVGIDGLGGMGFPKWVWSYRLPRSLTGETDE